MTAPTPALVIMGPTASGKSALALAAAQRFNGEIVSADSMQVYRRLNIGAAKPSVGEQQLVPHHLIDILDFTCPLEVFTFVKLAEEAMAAIRSRGRLPVIVGGTGFYLKALLYGLDPLPADAALRADLDLRFDHDRGHEELKDIMSQVDPEDLARWHDNRRKLIRAYEVFLLTGQSITALQTINRPQLRFPVAAFCLDWERETLKQRIADRTDAMLREGWIEEARQLLADGLMESPTARQAIGYGIIGEYLAGRIDAATMREKIVTGTWQFARRQLTWFRHQHPEAVSLPMPMLPEDAMKQIAAALRCR